MTRLHTTRKKRPQATPTIRRLRQEILELRSEGEDLTCGDVLRHLQPRFRTLGRSLAWLMAHEDDDEVCALVTTLLVVGAGQDPSVGPGLRARVLGQASGLAEEAIRDPGVDDERKLLLNAVLGLSGQELSGAELRACFVDYEGVVTRAASTLSDGVEAVESALDGAGLGAMEPLTDAADRVRALLDSAATIARANERVGATLLVVAVAIGQHVGGVSEVDLCRALEAAAATDPARALALLSELGGWPSAGAVGAKAREVSLRLRAQGVSPCPLPAPTFARGLVSAVDGSGSRAMLLLYTRADGRLDALSFVLNDRVGLKDVWAALGEGADIQRQFEQVGLPLTDCDQAFARELIAETLAVNEAAARPVPGRWSVYRAYLGDAPLGPARRAPRLDAYALNAVARRARLGDRSADLLDSPVYAQLGFDSDAAYEFVRRRAGRRPYELSITDALVTDFLRAVEPHERERVTRRLAVNLELEARAGRAKRRLNRLAAETWIALAEGLRPFDALPYARALAAQSLEAIAHNVSLGYRTQDQANQASLDTDEDFAAFVADLTGLRP